MAYGFRAVTFRIGIDVGGTFTDYVAFRGEHDVVSGKTPSTPGRESDAVIDALSRAARGFEVGLEELLASTDVINFGTTVATNAMLEHKGALVGMLTTKGFRDVIDLRRGYKESLTDIRLAAPKPIVRRRHRIGVSERVGPDGTVLVPLDEDEVRSAVARLSGEGIRSYAVCLLQAHANPAHEHRCAEIIAEHDPDAHISVSTNVLNQIGEFERFSTTLINAYLSPVLRDYMGRLLTELGGRGFAGQLLVMQSNGGTGAAGDMGRHGVGALLSGPAGGVVAASELGLAAGFPNVIGVDMGGTSYDLSLVRGGRPQLRTDAWAARYRVGLSILDIHTIGAGGGSIAWIDKGGALRVGPQSAGATPGPACYGRGGELPTVTDANLVLGYLSADNFLGGEMTVDPASAEVAIEEHVAVPLGISLVEAAVGIARIVNSNMSNGIRYVSVARGHDPRDFALLAFGGAAATHAPVQARDLGITTILVPRAAGVLSAYGTLLSDLKVSTSAPHLGLAENVEVTEIDRIFAELRASNEELVQTGGVEAVEQRLFADFRYSGQVHELTIPILSGNGHVTQDDWHRAVESFHISHEQLYTFRLAHKPVELITLRLDLVGMRAKLDWRYDRADAEGEPRPKAYREAWIPDTDGTYAPCLTPIYDGSRIQAGQAVTGPAVIEEANTTIVLHAGDHAWLGDRGIYRISIAEEAS
jgi:N-methylhydantoinase A